MAKVAEIADRKYVTSQYQNPANLNARILLHQRFSTNKYGWQRWVFDQFDLSPHSRILELGCGPGDLWVENTQRIPTGWNIVLSDFSLGMLQHTNQRLGGDLKFSFAVIDAQSIPFTRRCFEAVIANSMLYHVPDRARALAEIRQVLKPDGRFYAATGGERHLQEIADLATRFDPRLASWRESLSDSFTLENGAAQISRWFDRVTLRRYEDSFAITKAAPLVDYILSGRIQLSPEVQSDFSRFVERELAMSGGMIHVTKDFGLFEASDA